MIQKNDISQRVLLSLTPQFKKNTKSIQFQIISNRISLIKRQLKKHRDEASLDKNLLSSMYEKGRYFQQKLRDQIQKCEQLKRQKRQRTFLGNSENLRKQNKKQNFITNKQDYNLKDQLKKDVKNQNMEADQNRKQIDQIGILQKLNQRDKTEKKSKKKTKRKITQHSLKNFNFLQTDKSFYLKVTFLTSIIFILLGTILRQYLLTF